MALNVGNTTTDCLDSSGLLRDLQLTGIGSFEKRVTQLYECGDK